MLPQSVYLLLSLKYQTIGLLPVGAAISAKSTAPDANIPLAFKSKLKK